MSERPVSGELRDVVGMALAETTRRPWVMPDVWRSAFEASPVGMSILDRDHRIVAMNAAMAETMGVPREVALGRPGYEVAPGDPDPIRPLVDEVFRTGMPLLEREVTGRAFPGAPVRTRVFSLQPLHDDLGEVAAVLSTVRDVTVRRAAEAASRQREAELDALYDSAPVGLCLFDRELRYVRINKRLADVNGLPAEAHLGRRMSEMPFDDAGRAAAVALESKVRRVLETGQPLTEEVHGPEHIWRATWSPLHGKNGEIAGVNTVVEEITGLRRAERDARSAADELNALYQSAPIGMCVLDPDLRWVRINDLLAKLNGFPPEAHIGKRVHELLPDLAPVIEEICATLRRTGEPLLGREIPEETPQGVRWWRASYFPLHDAAGAFAGINVVADDITGRRNAELRIATSEALARTRLDELNATYRTAPIGMCVVDRDMRFVRINERLAEINGVPAADHIGKTLWDIVPGLADEVAEMFRRILETGEPVLDHELRGETRAQPGVERIWVEQFYPLVDSQGAVIGVNVVCEEVTERRRAELALARSEERLRLAQMAAKIGTWEMNLRDGALAVSESWLALYGLPQGSPAPAFEQWLELVHPDDRAKLGNDPARNRSAFDSEFRIRRTDGEERWIAARATMVKDADGAPERVLGVNIDITDRKAGEEHRELLVRELDHRVKNILSIVQSISALTLRAAKSPEEFHENFAGRIAALTRAHDLLTKGRWQNAELEGLIAQTLAPYGGGGAAIVTSGAPLRLTPPSAISVAMVLHELATNAAKYGALSAQGGRLDLSWTREGDDIVVRWRESGGPRVEQPARKGFGSLLVQRSVAHELKGRADIVYEPAGVCAELRFPAAGNLA